MKKEINKKIQGECQQSSQNSICYLGIEFKSDVVQGMDYREVAARIFLSSLIPCEKAIAVANSLEREKMSIDSFLRRTNVQIQSLREKDENVTDKMVDKIERWIDEFGFRAEEIDFITDLFGFTYEDLMDGGSQLKIFGPKELADYVKQFVIGQDEAIDQLAVPFAQHFESKQNGLCSSIKTPVLLMGPTGVGKSEISRRLTEVCHCPVIRINTTEMTPQSWRGLHISDFFLHYLKSGLSIQDLEYSIVIFNEFDKITHHSNRIVSDKGTDMDADMQRDIMQLFDRDATITISDDTPLSQYNGLRISVNNLLIVFDGAFSGIEEVIKKRCKVEKIIGFVDQSVTQRDINWMKMVCEQDLESWGYLPELIGRIGTFCVLNPLTIDMMMKIMSDAKESILQAHVDYCKQHNVDLVFTEDAKRYIAELACNSGLGFRNVRTLLSRCLSSMYFNMSLTADSDRHLVNVDKEYVQKVLDR